MTKGCCLEGGHLGIQDHVTLPPAGIIVRSRNVLRILTVLNKDARKYGKEPARNIAPEKCS
jgi:hypothetical protein